MDDMADQPNKSLILDNPPVIEMVIGVQFSPIPGFTSAHMGWFWKKYLDESWSIALDAPRLPDLTENFGDQISWTPQNIFSFMTAVAPESNRVQFTDANRERMLQVQNTRFHYNWQKRSSPYPSFCVNHKEFSRYFGVFNRFLLESGLGITPNNLWEITYIDHIPRGTLWDKPSDWITVFPGLFGSLSCPSGGIEFEGLGGEWRFEITPHRGRLRLSVQLGKVQEQDKEVLVLSATARGPIRDDETGWELDSGLNIGHDAIIKAFRDFASPKALAHWGIQ